MQIKPQYKLNVISALQMCVYNTVIRIANELVRFHHNIKATTHLSN